MDVTTTIEGIPNAVEQVTGLRDRAADLSRPLTQLGLHHQRKAQRILRSGERGVQSRNPASGLEGSITFRIEPPNVMEVGSNKAYAAQQQFGGVIRPVKANYLCIPIADNLGARGNPKYDSPREVPDGFFFRSKLGGLFYARSLGKTKTGKDRSRKRYKGRAISEAAYGDLRATMELLFVLVKEVVGTDHMYVTHDPADQAEWERFLRQWVIGEGGGHE